MKPEGQMYAIAAVIFKDGKVLCVRKPYSDNHDVSGKWVFPGCVTDILQNPESAIKRILKNKFIFGNHVNQICYRKHPQYDVSIQLYFCLIDSEVELCNQYAEQKWVNEEDLLEMKDFHECYHSALHAMKPINRYLCSAVRYNLFEKLNSEKYSMCQDQSIIKYGKQSESIKNVLVIKKEDYAQIECFVNEGVYYVDTVCQQDETPGGVDCILFFCQSSFFRMYGVKNIVVKHKVSENHNCTIFYQFSEEKKDFAVISHITELIKQNTDYHQFIVHLEKR